MGTSESWIDLKGDKLYLHTENDGPRVLRHGLESRDELLTGLDDPVFSRKPRFLEEACRQLTEAGFIVDLDKKTYRTA